MTIKQIVNIVSAGVILALIITIIILSSILSSCKKDLILVKQEKNYLSQTIEKMRQEEEVKSVIYKEKDELLLEVKKSTTLKEYLVIWEKINRSLK